VRREDGAVVCEAGAGEPPLHREAGDAGWCEEEVAVADAAVPF